MTNSLASLKREIAIVQKAIAPEQTRDSILSEVDRENTAKTIRALIIISKLEHNENIVLSDDDNAFLESELKEHDTFMALYEAGKLERRQVAGHGWFYYYTGTDTFYRGVCHGMTSEHLAFAKQVAATVTDRYVSTENP